ncbi:MAG: VWA domain-containing protein, partial [Haliscomenobacter sp.]
MNSIQPSFIPENNYWLTGQVPNAFYLYLELNAAEATKSPSRVPLNLSLVIDRSGSMGGEKIEFAKQAAKFVVDNLN